MEILMIKKLGGLSTLLAAALASLESFISSLKMSTFLS